MSSTCYSNTGRKNDDAAKQGISCQSVWNVNNVLPLQCLISDTFVWFRYHTQSNTIFSFYHITLQIRGISTAHQLQQNTKEATLLQLILLPYHICMRSCWAGSRVETPSLVFQYALIADWPEWDCRHRSHFLLQVTSCSIFPHPVLLSRVLNGLFQVTAAFVTPVTLQSAVTDHTECCKRHSKTTKLFCPPMRTYKTFTSGFRRAYSRMKREDYTCVTTPSILINNNVLKIKRCYFLFGFWPGGVVLKETHFSVIWILFTTLVNITIHLLSTTLTQQSALPFMRKEFLASTS